MPVFAALPLLRCWAPVLRVGWWGVYAGAARTAAAFRVTNELSQLLVSTQLATVPGLLLDPARVGLAAFRWGEPVGDEPAEITGAAAPIVR